jgi:hypothetical protein
LRREEHRVSPDIGLISDDACAQQDVRERMRIHLLFSMLLAVFASASPEGFAGQIRAEIKKWAKLVKDAGIRPEWHVRAESGSRERKASRSLLPLSRSSALPDLSA